VQVEQSEQQQHAAPADFTTSAAVLTPANDDTVKTNANIK